MIFLRYKYFHNLQNSYYDFTLEYTKGEDMPSDFLIRHVKVESVEVKVDPNLCFKKEF